MKIRFADPADQSTLAELLLASNRHYWGELDSAASMTAATADALISGKSGCKAVIAWLDGTPSAFATISVLHPALNEHGTLFMKDLFVAKGARGAGLGSHVMHHLAILAMELGCRRFDWTAETDNSKALAFYDALGATRVDEKVYFSFSDQSLMKFANAHCE